MTTASDRDRFRQRIHQFGGWAQLWHFSEAAKDNGLALSEALRVPGVGSLPFMGHANSDVLSIVSEFVSALTPQKPEGNVLEYSLTPWLLTAKHFENGSVANSSIVSPGADVAKVFRVLIDRDCVFERIDCLKGKEGFDLVVCQDPISMGSKGPGSDGFGGEIVLELEPYVSDAGRLVWLSSNRVLSAKKAQNTFAALQSKGLHKNAVIDLPTGAITGSPVGGALMVFERRTLNRKLVGGLRDHSAATPMAKSFLDGTAKKRGTTWVWHDHDDQRTFKGVEDAEFLKRLTPRGRREMLPLGSIVGRENVQKADKPIPEDSSAAAFIYVPEYAGSKVTADLDEQTVKHSAVYRVPIDTTRANPVFVANLLNAPYGRKARSSAAQGATIQRLSVSKMLGLILPLPDIDTQAQIASIETDLTILVSEFDELRKTMSRDWSVLGDVSESVEKLKAVLQLERQIEEWWRELPYPLATIYRRYQIATDPRERLDRLLHFFEMAAVFLAAIGTSHIRAVRSDWRVLFAKWFHPTGGAGIERTDFGFWSTLAGASLKELSRTASDKALRSEALEFAGSELVETAHEIGPIGKGRKPLEAARHYRNKWKGHGGYLKLSDVKRLDHELQQYVRDFFEAAAPLFRRLFLVLPGSAKLDASGESLRAELPMKVLSGSDPAFAIESAVFTRPTSSDSLAFWMKSTGSICSAIPIFRLGVPTEPQETSFYVFNRVENGGFRWISYHEAKQQDFIAVDEELRNLIDLRVSNPK